MRVLADLRDHLRQRADRPLPPALVADLRRALDAIETGVELRVAFGNGDHHRGLSALTRAAELVKPGAGAWARAGALAEALRRFRTMAWPRIRCGAREPVGELETALAAALQCYPWPTSQRQLYRLLQD